MEKARNIIISCKAKNLKKEIFIYNLLKTRIEDTKTQKELLLILKEA